MTETARVHDRSARPGVCNLEFGSDGIAVIRLGAPDEGMITLTEQRLDSLEAAADELAGRDDLRGVIVTGPRPGMFAAGADIGMIQSVTTPEQGAEGAVRGTTIFGKLGALPVPVVAAIDGPCLGGALEMSLALDYRIAAKGNQTSIGLPEVKPGI
ncbi:MAG: enoyl-CoA hydratase/isomerase family protein, partial [Planctomycetes bacterium]|nr:enoyl-CoA hydratase/isomerase family protein [Planctomycetota bacterium]